MRSRWLVFGLALGAFAGSVAIASCAGSGGSGVDGPLKSGHARLALKLVDAPNPRVDEINVTIAKVTAHSNTAGWVEIFNGNLTVDLLKLKTRTMDLGFQDLPAGKITQIRLYTLEGGLQEVVLPSGEHVPLKVPSGVQSGIKIKGPFNLSACSTTTVTLDFDGHKSIWVHPTGQEDLWILRPVIHAKHVESSPTPCLPPDGSGGGGGSGDIGEGGNPGTGGGTGTGGDTGGGGGSGSGVGDGGSGDLDEGGGSGGTSPGDTTLQPPRSAGSACTNASECLSNSCVEGVCGLSGPGGACRAGTDCASQTCGADGTCAIGAAGGTGSACTVNASCLSNTCTNGLCEAGNQGAPCREAGDCVEGFRCEVGFCEPLIN